MRHRLPLALLGALAVGGCGAHPGATPATAPDPATAGRLATPAAIAKARADSARYAYTAADIHFMSSMIGHHAQAIIISRWAPTHGASPAVLRLAERIINAQQDEIGTMQQWLRARQQPVPDARPMAMTMKMDGMEHEMLMPGMLTDEQMKQLDAARGAEFDKLFLRDMIQHHTGATVMVKQLFDTYGAGQDELVFKFASDVNVDQTTEIARMQKMLAALTLGITLPNSTY
ncbi:MAG: hypothetical protein JWM41_968 [Gemmatimonadetes bacterium]|nr:hypothetical protein [Gemmatimonadota bacterium]